MNLTWLDLKKSYVVKDEQRSNKEALAVEKIKLMIDRDHDYRLFIPCTYGEIYKFSEDGSTLCCTVKSNPKTKNTGHIAGRRLSVWRRIDATGATRHQEGDNECTWKFDAQLLVKVAKIMGAFSKVRRKRRKKS